MLRARILIAEDEADFAAPLAEFLDELGYEVETVATAAELNAALRARPRDLILLDLNLSGQSGFDILVDSALIGKAAVIVLTGNACTIDRIVGLEAGADDYLIKPIDLRELAARIGSVLARRLGRRRQIVLFERASADLNAARILYPDGQTAPLSAGEVALSAPSPKTRITCWIAAGCWNWRPPKPSRRWTAPSTTASPACAASSGQRRS